MISRELERRVNLFTLVVLIVFVVLGSRLAYMQLVQGRQYERLAEGNRIRRLPIAAPRGLFYDRYGTVMVTSRPAFTVSITPSPAATSDEVLSRLSGIIGMSVADIRKEMAAQAGRPFEPVRLKTNLSPEEHTRLEELKSELPGVIVDVQPIRDYLEGTSAAHILGYVGEINAEQLAADKDKFYQPGDIVGQSGLEKTLDRYLRGVDGGRLVEVDVRGRPVATLGQIDPAPGDNVILTIDSELQKVTEKALDASIDNLQKQGKTQTGVGAAVVLNVKTGEVLALASRPAFDPNLFASGISTQQYADILKKRALNDFAISGLYPPGSTFKMVTAVAALEEKVVTPQDTVFDPGVYSLTRQKCWVPQGHGLVNMYRAFEVSCNIFFYEMGTRLYQKGQYLLHDWAVKFGLGQKTGIDLPGEAAGSVAGPDSVKDLTDKRWYLADQDSSAIGQGFHAFTPIQMASYVAIVANGGIRYQPYIVKQVIQQDGKIVVDNKPQEVGRVEASPETWATVRQGMLGANMGPEGTAAWLFANYPIKTGGKTGSAENRGVETHGWYVAFAPYDDPEIAVAVVVENAGHGSSSAGPVVKAVFDQYFHLAKPEVDTSVNPTAPAADQAPNPVTTPPTDSTPADQPSNEQQTPSQTAPQPTGSVTTP
ncbi:MAG TPA: penicillin-binding protein 2 [Bacillota bacterium]